MKHFTMNPEQQEAVTYISGPLLVLAGAGSGKTRVITEKISYLIETCGMKAHHIVAVTFTNKAAREMKARVQERLPSKQTRGLTVATFHTFGLNLLQHEYTAAGLKQGFSIFDDQDSQTLLTELSYKQQVDKSVIERSQQAISRWKNALITPEQALKTANGDTEHTDALLYAAYQRHLRAYNAVDFDDLIFLPVHLLQTHVALREKWQHKIHYLLVDECQDSNVSQYQLIKLLVENRRTFTMVGDDDQSIYAWRGAQPENLALLQQDYPNLKLIKLEQNYRSTGCILKAANHLIRFNPHTVEKQLWSDLGYGSPIRVIQTKDEQDETNRIVTDIITHQFKHRTRFGEYAILYRGNFQSMSFEKELRKHRIPYKLSGSTSYFSKTEIKDVLAYLRLLTNPKDDCAFLRIINTPRREIGPATLEKLGEYANSRHLSMLEVINEMGLAQHLSPQYLERLQTFAAWHQRTADKLHQDCNLDNLKAMLNEVAYKEWLMDTATHPATAEKRIKNVDDFLEWIISLQSKRAEEGSNADLTTIINILLILDRIDQDDQDENDDRVNMLTLHAAKGLEFPYVYIAGLEEGILPHRNSIDAGTIEEERRLCYVGITRARKELTLIYASVRRRYGETISSEPSRFLKELPQDDLLYEGRTLNSVEERKALNLTKMEELRALLKVNKN